MQLLEAEVDALAGATFSGVVRVDLGDELVLAKAYGFAHRGNAVVNTTDTRFGAASATKGLTAAAVMILIGDGTLALSTTARSVLGTDLPLVDDDVTVEHLLAHRSGIGDYVDEGLPGDINDILLTVPAQDLATTEDYLAVLGGHEAKFAPGARFSYCNSGFVILALIAERVSGVPFAELVRQRVCGPAGMIDTEFFRSDALPERTALGYLDADGSRTNVFHLPVRGSGDGGIFTTVGDIRSFWLALFDGRIVEPPLLADMLRARGATTPGANRYGLGFWLHEASDVVQLEGSDAGVSFWSAHDPTRRLTSTVISNVSDGAWPIARMLDERLRVGST